jgi:hypothetical protein
MVSQAAAASSSSVWTVDFIWPTFRVQQLTQAIRVHIAWPETDEPTEVEIFYSFHRLSGVSDLLCKINAR